jgi:hypothetical protein
MSRRAETIIFAIIGLLLAILAFANLIDDFRHGGLNWRLSLNLLRSVAILIIPVAIIIYRNRQGSTIHHPFKEEEL